MKQIFCKAGETTKVVHHVTRHMPREFDISITAEGNRKPLGKYTETKYFLYIHKKVSEGQLKEKMQFHRGWCDTIYILKFKPDCDITVTIK